MTQANDLTFPLVDVRENFIQVGLTKREYFASTIQGEPTTDFYELMLKKFDEETGNTRTSTNRTAATLMSVDEIIKTKAAWKVKQADALIEALNKEEGK